MHQSDVGDELSGRQRRALDVREDRLSNARVPGPQGFHSLNGPIGRMGEPKEGGHIDPFDFGEGAEEILFRSLSLPLPLPHFSADLDRRIFPVPDHDGVEQECHGLRVEARRPPGDHQGVREVPLLGEKWDGRESEDGEDVGEGQLVLKAEPEDVEIPDCTAGFQGVDPRAPLDATLFPCPPRGSRPFPRRAKDERSADDRGSSAPGGTSPPRTRPGRQGPSRPPRTKGPCGRNGSPRRYNGRDDVCRQTTVHQKNSFRIFDLSHRFYFGGV